MKRSMSAIVSCMVARICTTTGFSSAVTKFGMVRWKMTAEYAEDYDYSKNVRLA